MRWISVSVGLGAALVVVLITRMGGPAPSRTLSGSSPSHARQQASRETVAREVVSSPSCAITVTVSDVSGAPVPGLEVSLGSAGERARATTDDNGKARFVDLPAKKLSVFWRQSSGWSDLFSGFADLRQQSTAEVKIVVEREVEVLAEVTLAGTPGLPDRYRVFTHSGEVQGQQVDRVAGTIRFRFRPRRPQGPFFLEVPGFMTARAPFSPRMAFEVRKAYRARISVISPHDRSKQLVLEKREPTTGRWAHYSPIESWSSVELASGQYRIADYRSGKRGASVQIPDETLLSIDLSSAGWVTGRVELPAGQWPVSFARVVAPHHNVEVDERGAFKVRVPGDRLVRLRAIHPLFKAAESVDVLKPQANVVLEMSLTNLAFLELADRNMTTFRGSATVILSGDSGKPTRHRMVPVGRRFAFGRFFAGRYDLWFDIGGLAPFRMNDVDLTADTNDLGVTNPSEGASIVITSSSELSFRFVAYSESEPKYKRTAVSEDGTYRILGLQPGRFHVVGTVDIRGHDQERLLDRIVIVKRAGSCVTLDLGGR